MISGCGCHRGIPHTYIHRNSRVQADNFCTIGKSRAVSGAGVRRTDAMRAAIFKEKTYDFTATR